MKNLNYLHRALNVLVNLSLIINSFILSIFLMIYFFSSTDKVNLILLLPICIFIARILIYKFSLVKNIRANHIMDFLLIFLIYFGFQSNSLAIFNISILFAINFILVKSESAKPIS